MCTAQTRTAAEVELRQSDWRPGDPLRAWEPVGDKVFDAALLLKQADAHDAVRLLATGSDPGPDGILAFGRLNSWSFHFGYEPVVDLTNSPRLDPEFYNLWQSNREFFLKYCRTGG